ncbi:RHS repeat protein [Serratia proteamaculans]|uniref:YD repeat protein n=1 Tax=Serratia proteamaculans TaxID=28151 RepID=A0A5Q2VDH0_SERPR|nr:RHS repeat protein [Serratia proteamaculans]QGH62045.1 hypothetical protein GHV41_14970 [Serratia proteamaculans]
MISSEFHSQASNFTSAVQGSVDPRTGLFMLNMPLVSLKGNSQMGPELNLALNYSPVSQTNHGLGKGLTLGLSHVDTESSTLTLSTGEQYKIIPGTVELRHKKMDNFRLEFAHNGSGYQIIYADGRIEYLTYQVGEQFMPTRVVSPLGQSLLFTWYSSNLPMLLSVHDDTDETLCSFDYSLTSQPVLNILPGTSAHRQISLQLTSDMLTQLNCQVSESKNNLVWTMEYDWIDPRQSLWGMTGVISPIGNKESVIYDMADGMRFPAGASVNGSLPRVIEHRRSPGAGQPDMVSQFEYSSNNYLGNNGSFGEWASDSDYLYNTLTDYTYSSKETTSDSAGTSITTTRFWNNYHLQIQEEMWKGDCIHRTETTYHALPGVHFSDQSVNCLQPYEVTQSWHQGAESRSETTVTKFDEKHGHLIKEVKPDGTVTEYTYYPAEGGDGCPEEPHGFARFLKSTTVTPPDVYGDEPTQRTEYRYKKMGTLSGSHVAYSILQDTVTHKINDQIKFTEAFIYHDDEGVNFGRVKTKTQTQYGKDSEKYISRQHLSVTVQGERLVQTVDSKILDEDGVSLLFSVSSTSELCRATGKMLSETDAAGNRVDYNYDNLGRLLKKTHHPDKPEYKSIETYDYFLPDVKAGTPAQTVHTDIRGNKTRVDYDGLGRKLAQWITDRDSVMQKGESEWSQVAGLEYDSTGLAGRLTQRDLLHTGKATRQVVEGWKTRTWDKWGQPYSEKRHDGVVSYSETDPIALTVTSWTASEDGKKVTGKQVVHYNQNQQPVKTELFTTEGKSYAVNLQDWDGAQRLRKTTDTLKRVTTFTYDDEGRVTKTRLPDDSVIKKSYAPFTSEALITQISLTEKGGSEQILGKQIFDRLGRLKETISGGRTTTMTYDFTWQTQPSTVTGPDKVVQTFTRDPALGEAVTALNAGSGSNAMSQSFDYHRPTATLEESKESDTTTSWTLYPSGRIKSEVATIKGGAKNAQGFKYSLSGAVEQDTDISNITRQHHYGISGKSAGQLLEVSDKDVTLTPAYDELQRMTEWTAKDKAGRTLRTELTLDDFGREEVRKVTHSNGESFILTQMWKPNNQLESRTRSRGDKVLLRETYFYDERNRLEIYQAGPVGGELPKDPYGNAFTEQHFTFDALGNIRTCTTVLQGGSQNMTTFHFDNPADPCQLTSVTNSLTGKNYPPKITLEYDEAGRMTKDEAGRTLRYDALGRLQQVISEKGSGGYGYDASNRLCWQIVDKTQQLHRLYYRGNKLANEWLTPEGQSQDAAKDSRVRLVYAGGSSIAQINQDGSTSTTSLIGTDAKNSVVATQGEGENQQYQYTPYGYQTDVDAGNNVAEASEAYRDE